MPRSNELFDELTAYGALPSQLVDVSREEEPRVLGYLDLRTPSPEWRLPVVVENAGRPCVHVFDARAGALPEAIQAWCWRVALRGDGAWIGVLEPGRLRVFRADVTADRVVPVELQSAAPGDWALPRFLNDVTAGQDDLARRRYLKRLLDRSAQDAKARGLGERDALSLVGRGLFWRFLMDRGLLAGLQPQDVCPPATAWEHCLDEKSRARHTFRWLDETFNGGLLPFEASLRDFDPALFSRVLGNIAHGAAETGQMRLPTDWSEVNFSYVPVGLLSEVYEAFAHSIDAGEAARRSIHYTPSHLVDFIVSQALAELPAGGRPRVLDPAAGAGVFLVTALRKLVERDWRETGERPRRRRIRDILNHQLAGFDIDGRALRLAELALYLTALELDPRPRPLKDLKFDELRGNVLFDVSAAPHGSLSPVEDRFRGAFDLVIGNPPWTAQDRALSDKRAWVSHTTALVKDRLGEERALAFDLPDTNMDLPFAWRAMEWAKKGGRIALVTHARWLFGLSERAVQARNDLLEATRVTGILNGAALRLTSVWPEVDAPWCVLFATNERPGPLDHYAFQYISPALDTETDARQARLRMDWLDAHTVLAADVMERPWTLKARFRGNPLAERALDALRRAGQELGDYLYHLGTRFKNGYQIGAKAGKQVDSTHMLRMPDTKGAPALGFVVDPGQLPLFDRRTLLFPRDPSIYKAPLLLLRKAVLADLSLSRTHLAQTDIAFHESYHGASFAGVEGGLDIAAYLQIVLQSSLYPFFEILTDAQYGVFVDAIYLESAARLPVVPFERLPEAQRDEARRLAALLRQGMTADLAARIDTFVFDTFDLTPVEREAIRDTVDTALPSTESKRRAAAPPRPGERARFIEILQDSLESVLSASRLRVNALERADLTWSPWRVLEVTISRRPPRPKAPAPADTFLQEADEGGASMVLVRSNDTTWLIGLLDRYSLWTPTRARLLAATLLHERTRP